MKRPLVRIIVSGIIFSFIGGIIVTIVGLFLKWKTPAEFSNAYFAVGAVLIIIGLVTLIGTYNERTVVGFENSQSAVRLDAMDRFRIWENDIARGKNKLAFLGTAGILLVGQSGFALLVGKWLGL